MNPGQGYPSIVMAVQVLVTHADRVTIMAREMGHPPRIIRGPDVCDLVQARDAARHDPAKHRQAVIPAHRPPG